MPDTEIAVQSATQMERRPTFAPRTLDEAFRFAEMLLESGMLPKSYVGKTPATIVVALQFGLEVGLAPLQALQNIANINGQPSLWGDAALALCKSYPNIFEYIIEDDFETIKSQKFARCRVKRRNEPNEVVRTFSLEDAKQGGLLGKQNVWATYPARMMQMRARAFALRDTFPDILKGLAIAEEVQDYQTVEASTYVAPQQQEQKPAADPIGAPGATLFYKVYTGSGWTKQDADRFLKERFGIEHPRDSRDLPATGKVTVGDSKTEVVVNLEAMEWAKQPKPKKESIPSTLAPDPSEENMDADPA